MLLLPGWLCTVTWAGLLYLVSYGCFLQLRVVSPLRKLLERNHQHRQQSGLHSMPFQPVEQRLIAVPVRGVPGGPATVAVARWLRHVPGEPIFQCIDVVYVRGLSSRMDANPRSVAVPGVCPRDCFPCIFSAMLALYPWFIRKRVRKLFVSPMQPRFVRSIQRHSELRDGPGWRVCGWIRGNDLYELHIWRRAEPAKPSGQHILCRVQCWNLQSGRRLGLMFAMPFW